MMRELPKTYDPKAVEKKIYDMWMEGGYFKGVADKSKKPFSIVMPPPNVTGQLHMGHALDATLQDILTRYKRMQGYAALWLPGVDHAGIATQIKVEEVLRKEEGLSRYDLAGRNSWSGSGTGSSSTATGSWSSRRAWASPATGTEAASPWTKSAPGLSGRPSATCTRRA